MNLLLFIPIQLSFLMSHANLITLARAAQGLLIPNIPLNELLHLLCGVSNYMLPRSFSQPFTPQFYNYYDYIDALFQFFFFFFIRKLSLSSLLVFFILTNRLKLLSFSLGSINGGISLELNGVYFSDLQLFRRILIQTSYCSFHGICRIWQKETSFIVQ